MRTKPLSLWVNERHAIWHRKQVAEMTLLGQHGSAEALLANPDLREVFWGRSAPRLITPDNLTLDPILAKYSFCNVFRELDRVTLWIDENIRKPYADHPELWFMLCAARTVNWPGTLADMIAEHPDDWWLPLNMEQSMESRAARGEKVYTGAYMIRAESNPQREWYSWSKHRYIARIVLGRLWHDRPDWRRHFQDPGRTLQSTHQRFLAPYYVGWGPFMAYQAVVDMRHTKLLKDAPDINTWAALGPGSRRGLNRLNGREPSAPLTQEQGLSEMRKLLLGQDRWRASWVPEIELSDIQNCLCETDKYLRVQNGEGRPRATYSPGRKD